MAIIFDPSAKRIILDSAAVSAADLYSRSCDWLLLADNVKYGQVFRQVGGDDIDSVKGTLIPPYFFLQGSWRVRPMEANHLLVIDGNLLVDGGGSPIVATIGNYNVSAQFTVPVQAQAFSSGGGSVEASSIADAVWNKLLSEYTGAGSAGKALATASSGGVDLQLLTNAILDEPLTAHVVEGSVGKVLLDKGSSCISVSPETTRRLEDTVVIDFTTHSPATGITKNADALPTCRVFEGASSVPILTPLVVNRGEAGLYYVTFVASDVNGFEVGKTYNVLVDVIVDSLSIKSYISSFSINDLARASGAVVTNVSNSSVSFVTDREETTDYWKDNLILFVSGGLVNQVRKVTAFNATTKAITVASGFTTTPANGDRFVFIGF